jgi:hypothetical protein
MIVNGLFVKEYDTGGKAEEMSSSNTVPCNPNWDSGARSKIITSFLPSNLFGKTLARDTHVLFTSVPDP